MANETLKAGFDAYMADADAKCQKFPERANLEPNRLYTPLDVEGFDYEKDLGFPGNILSPVAFSLPCTVANSGPCVCMPASPLLKNPTNVIATC